MDIERFVAIADQIQYRFAFCYPYRKPKLPSRWYHDSTAIRGQRSFFKRFLKDRSYFIIPGYGCLNSDFFGGFHGDDTINVKESFSFGDKSNRKFNSGIYYSKKNENLELDKANAATNVLARYRPQHILFRSYPTGKAHLISFDWENPDKTSHEVITISDDLNFHVKFIIGISYAQYLELEYMFEYISKNMDIDESLLSDHCDIFNLKDHPYRLKISPFSIDNADD